MMRQSLLSIVACLIVGMSAEAQRGPIASSVGPGITVSTATAQPLHTTEAGGQAQFSVNLNTPPVAAVHVNVVSNNPNEGSVSPSGLDFTAANFNTPQMVTITGVDDLVADGNQTYTIGTHASSTDPAYNNISGADVSVVNADNDRAQFILARVCTGISLQLCSTDPYYTYPPYYKVFTSESGAQVPLTLQLATQPVANVTVNFASDNTSEGIVTPSSVTLTPADWNQPHAVVIAGVDDHVRDGAVPYTILISVNTTDPAYAALTIPNIPLFNRDNDLVRGDFDGDGKADLLWFNPLTVETDMYLMDGLNVRSRQVVQQGGAVPVGTGDFSPDNRTDIAWDVSYVGIGQYCSSSFGFIYAGAKPYYGSTAAITVGAGDFAGEGTAQIFWRLSTGENLIEHVNVGSTYQCGGGQIYGGASTDSINTVDPGSGWEIVDLADFDGDGHTDILWRNVNTGEVYLYLMNNNVIRAYGRVTILSDLNWHIGGVGDFNGDGKADILWRNAPTGANYIYFMDGRRIVQQDYVNSVDPAWQVATVRDLNGDGLADIVWRNGSTGDVYIYIMYGSRIGPNRLVTTVPDQNWQIFTR